MRYAIPVADGVVCAHFGHCQHFALFDVDETSKKIVSRTQLETPPHQPGLLPRMLAEEGVTVVIAGGMGSRALDIFEQNRIQVVIGAPEIDPESAVQEFLQGTLSAGDNICDH
jgi:ATP-binding protein involved in chromosome partitioning